MTFAAHTARLLEAPIIGIGLTCTEIAAEDEREFLDASRQSERLHGKWVRAPRTTDEFQRYLERSRRDDCFEFLFWHDQQLVGTVGFRNIIYESMSSANIGFYAFEGGAGKGLMTEAVEMAIDIAFTRIELHRIEAHVHPDNLRSRSLLERLGFCFEGVSRKLHFVHDAWRDHERWALLSDEWTETGRWTKR